MGSFSEEPSTLEDAGTEPRRGRLGSYGGVGLEKMWYIPPSFYKFLSFPAIWKGDMQIYLAEFEAAYKFCIIFKLG